MSSSSANYDDCTGPFLSIGISSLPLVVTMLTDTQPSDHLVTKMGPREGYLCLYGCKWHGQMRIFFPILARLT